MGNFKGIIVGSLIARLLLFVGDSTLAVDSKEAAPSGKLENRARAGEKLEPHDRFKAEQKALSERLETEKQALHKRFEEERKSLHERFKTEEKALRERFEAEKQKLHSRFAEEKKALHARSK